MNYCLKNKELQSKLMAIDPKFLEKLNKEIEEKPNKCVHQIELDDKDGSLAMRVVVGFNDISVNLKLNVWYPREKWDGNPHGYIVLCKSFGSFFVEYKNQLDRDCSHFSYILPAEEDSENED